MPPPLRRLPFQWDRHRWRTRSTEVTMVATSVGRTKTPGRGRSRSTHRQTVPVPPPDDEGGSVPDQPFSDPARDMIDPALRHRMISEAAYRRYVERGYADGYDLDDWLQAEAAVEQLLETAMRSEAVRTPESRSNDTAARGGQASAPHSVAHDEG